MSEHATVEVAGAGSSRSDSSGSLVLFTYLKTTQGEKMVKWKIIFIEVVVFVLFLGGMIANLTDHLFKKNHVIWVYAPWKWCVLVLVIVGGRRITGSMMDLVVFLIEKKSPDSTQNKTFPFSLLEKIFSSMKYNVYYSYYIYSLRKSIRAVLWFGSILLTWFILFKNGGVKASKLDSHALKYVRRTIATSAIGGFLWVLKTLLVNALSSPFQATRLFDRFRESLIDQYILHVFSGEASKEGAKWIHDNHWPQYDCITPPAGGRQGWVKVINWLKKIQPEKLSAWTMKELIEVIRTTQLSSITEELENLAKKELDKKILFEKTDDVAKKNFIFKNKEDGDVVADQILIRRMNGAGEIEEFPLETLFNGEAGDVVQHINGGEKVAGNECQTLGRQALRKWLVDAVAERRSLAQTLEDSRRAKEDLNKIVSGTVLILVFIIWLIFLRMLTTGALVVIISQFAALTFIFGDAFKSVFQGIIFVSVTHPFDIGDCCLIDGEEMMVEKINLLSTVLRKNMDKIVYPNSVLIGMPIKNLDKGNRHLISDSFEIAIDSSTPNKKIDELDEEIAGFMYNHKDIWLLEHDFNLKEIENQKLKIVLSVSYRKTDLLSDWKMMNSRRDILVRKLKDLLTQNNIKFYNILPKAVDVE